MTKKQRIAKEKREAKEKFDAWYAQNKEEYNRKRRERYANDVKYRKQAIESAERYRKEGPAAPKTRSKKFRKYKGVEVRVFTIGEAAKAVNRSTQTIRQWEKDKLIPRPVFKGTSHRLYTEHQIKLLTEFADVVKNNWKSPQVVLQASKHVRSEWRNL